MNKKQLKSSEKPFSVLRTRLRRSPRFNPLESKPQPPLEDKISVEPIRNINSLPEEILIGIFKHLKQNELGLVSSVCRDWNRYAQNPVLWEKVDVTFMWKHGSQNEVVLSFSNKLTFSITYMKLDFDGKRIWKENLNFQGFCMILRERCPHLHTLILHHADFSVILSSVIDLCNDFLPNLKVLILHKSWFHNSCWERKNGGVSNIKVLAVSQSQTIARSTMYSFPSMPNLKKLSLFGTFETDNWFSHENDMSFLHQLQLLHLSCSNIHSRTFHILQNYAVNLIELFLCYTELNDDDISFNNNAFPFLKTICLRHCRYITCEGVVYLVRKCKSLQNVYVNKNIVKSYAEHPFLNTNFSKVLIVKHIDNYYEHEENHYFV